MKTIHDDKVSRHFFAMIVKIIILLLAIIVLLAATLLTAPRIALGYLNRHKLTVEHQLSAQLQLPVSVGHIDLWWHGLGPTLQLQNVSVAHNLNEKTIAIDVDAVRSILHWHLIIRRIVLQQANYQVQHIGNKWVVNGVTLPQSSAGGINLSDYYPYQGIRLRDVATAWIQPHRQSILHLHDATIRWQPDANHFQISADGVRLADQRVFLQPVSLNHVQTDFFIQQRSKQTRIILSSLVADNARLQSHLSGEVIVYDRAKHPVYLQLRSQLHYRDCQYLQSILPLKLIAPHTSEWLRQAFKSGDLSLNAVVQGAADQFPYLQHQGIFEVKGVIKHLGLLFNRQWPELTANIVHLRTQGKDLIIQPEKAYLRHLSSQDVKVTIPLFAQGAPILLASLSAQGYCQSMLDLLLHSPLSHIGEHIADFSPQGQAKLHLFLHVPLRHTVDTHVLGQLRFQHTTASLLGHNNNLRDINGTIAFTEHGLTAKHLQGQLYGEPTVFAIDTLVNSAGLRTMHMKVQGHLNRLVISSLFPNRFDSLMSGSAPYMLYVLQDLNAKEKTSTIVQLQSTLNGVGLDLPGALHKAAQQSRMLQIQERYYDKQFSNIKIQYANALSMDVDQLAMLHQQHQDTPGLSVEIHLAKVVWHDWYQYLRKHFFSRDYGAATQQSSRYFNNIVNIDVDVKRARLLGQSLRHVTMQVQPSGSAWLMRINSNVLDGSVRWPLRNTPIVANFNKFYFVSTPSSGKKLSPQLSVTQVRPFTLSITDLQYNHHPLGRLQMSVVRQGQQLLLQHCQLWGKNANVNVSGSWLQTGQQKMTHLFGKIRVLNLSQLLSDIGVADLHGLSFTATAAQFDLGWQGDLDQPSLKTLSGTFSLDLGPGNIADIGKNAESKLDLGRLLNALSVQSLLQKLTLNFDDYKTGYNFTSMKGNFSLHNGVLHTAQTTFDGSVAMVVFSGAINLLDHQLDLSLAVEPKVTGSVPVVAGLLVNPAVGVAAWFANLFFSSAVSHASTHYFTLHGPWQAPQIKAIKKQQSSQNEGNHHDNR